MMFCRYLVLPGREATKLKRRQSGSPSLTPPFFRRGGSRRTSLPVPASRTQKRPSENEGPGAGSRGQVRVTVELDRRRSHIRRPPQDGACSTQTAYTPRRSAQAAFL